MSLWILAKLAKWLKRGREHESVAQALTIAKFWIFERDEEDEQKIARCSRSYIERFFEKSDEVAAKKPKLQPEGLVQQTHESGKFGVFAR